MAQEKLVDAHIGKLGRLTKPAMVGVIGLGKLLSALRDDVRRKWLLTFCGQGHPLQRRENLFDASLNILRFFTISVGHTLQDFWKPWNAVAVLRRKIGAAVKRLALRGKENGHGPAAAAREHLHRIHVDFIEIGPLLAIDFDIDEEIVHEGGDLFVFERLTFHHVTPVTGGITDAQEDWSVFAFGFAESLVTPRVPIHWIVGVLKQIGACLMNKVIGVFVFHSKTLTQSTVSRNQVACG